MPTVALRLQRGISGAGTAFAAVANFRASRSTTS